VLVKELASSNMPEIQAFHLGQVAKHGVWTDHTEMRRAIMNSTVLPLIRFDGDPMLYMNAAHEVITNQVSTKQSTNKQGMTSYVVGQGICWCS
jgi:hypothetical protein